MKRSAAAWNKCGYRGLITLGMLLGTLTSSGNAQTRVPALEDSSILTSTSQSTFDLTLPGGNLTLCQKPYALCAASTCTLLKGVTVTNNAGDTFDAASCLCPVLPGPAFADVNAGNMNGKNCAPPAGGGVWSLFFPKLIIPQQTAKGTWKNRLARPQNCPGTSNGGQIVNCFSWSCSAPVRMNGVEVAQCTCPIQPVTSDTFAIQSGMCDQAACNEFPVAAPITVPDFCADSEGLK